jgi:hypothetical protein
MKHQLHINDWNKSGHWHGRVDVNEEEEEEEEDEEDNDDYAPTCLNSLLSQPEFQSKMTADILTQFTLRNINNATEF